MLFMLCVFSAQFSCTVMSESLRPHGLQHTRLLGPSLSPTVCANSCPLSQWCHPTISSSVIPFSSCLQFFPASGSFPVSQFFTSSGQIIGASASASVLPMNIQDWFPLGLTGMISLQSKHLEKHLFLFYWLHQSLWLCGSQQTVENSSTDGNTRPPDLPPGKSVCRSRSNRTKHGTTDRFQIRKGAHQGCTLSPCLFNLYAEYIMRNAGLDEAQAGIKIAGRNISNLR